MRLASRIRTVNKVHLQRFTKMLQGLSFEGKDTGYQGPGSSVGQDAKLVHPGLPYWSVHR